MTVPVGRSGTSDSPRSLHLGYDSDPEAAAQVHPNHGSRGLEPLQIKQGSCRRQKPMGSPNSRSEAANRSLLLLVSLCARLLRCGEGQGCRPIPSPSPPFMQTKRQPWWHDFVLSRGPGSPSPSFPRTVCA